MDESEQGGFSAIAAERDRCSAVSSRRRSGKAVGRTRRAAGRTLVAIGTLAAVVWFLSGWYRLAVVHGRWTTTFQGGHVVSCGLTPSSPSISVATHGGHPSLTAYKWTAFPQAIWGVEYQWNVLLASHAYNPINGFSGWSVVVWPVPVVLWGAGALVLAWGRTAQRRAMAGLCRRCGYSVAELKEGAPCPECGDKAK